MLDPNIWNKHDKKVWGWKWKTLAGHQNHSRIVRGEKRNYSLWLDSQISSHSFRWIKIAQIHMDGLIYVISKMTIWMDADSIIVNRSSPNCCCFRRFHQIASRVSCKHRQALQTDCSIPLIIRVESSNHCNQSAWLAYVYTIHLMPWQRRRLVSGSYSLQLIMTMSSLSWATRFCA